MARQIIDIGSAANDGTGDTLRQAAQKINDTLLEIYTQFGDSDNLSSIVFVESDGLVFQPGVNKLTVKASSLPAADRDILLPDANGTIILDSDTQTLTNKTLDQAILQSPTISSQINDSNGAELLKVTATASAVNEITLVNAATGNAPTLIASGTDTNVGLGLSGKGTGSVEIQKAAFSSVEITTNGTASATASYIVCNKGTALAVGLDSGTTVGEFKIFTNKGAGTATVTPTAFAQGTTFSIPQYAGAQTVWDGDNWYLVGVDGESDGAYAGVLVDYINRAELDSDLGNYVSISTLQTLSSSSDSFGAFQTLIAAL